MPTDTYGFDTPTIKVSKPSKNPNHQTSFSTEEETREALALANGESRGFVAREASKNIPRRKPGPKQKEQQSRITIPGPKRVVDKYRNYCETKNLSLWEGLEELLRNKL